MVSTLRVPRSRFRTLGENVNLPSRPKYFMKRGAGVTPPSFSDPSDISGLTVWLDAAQDVYSDAGVTAAGNGDTVEEWHDQTTGKVFSNTTLAEKPILRTNVQNSLPGVDFDGNDDILSHATAVLSGSTGTVFIVWMTDTTVANQYIWSSGDTASTSHHIGMISEQGSLGPAFANRQSGTNSILRLDETETAGTTYSTMLSSNGTAYTFRQDGADSSETVVTGTDDGDWFGDITGLDVLTLGALHRSSIISHWSGKILEFIAYDGVTLTSENITNVESYINTKYAIY